MMLHAPSDGAEVHLEALPRPSILHRCPYCIPCQACRRCTGRWMRQRFRRMPWGHSSRQFVGRTSRTGQHLRWAQMPITLLGRGLMHKVPWSR